MAEVYTIYGAKFWFKLAQTGFN